MRRHARILFAVAALASFFAFATTAFAGYEETGKIGGTGPNSGGSGPEDGQFFNPNQVAVNDTTGRIYVADTGNNRVQVFKPNATAGEYEAQLSIPAPTGVAIDQASGDIYVANASGVAKFDSALAPRSGWSAPAATGALAVDPSSGDLLLADRGANLIRRFGSGGAVKPGAFAAEGPISLAANSGGDVFVVTTTGDIYGCGASSTVKRFSGAGSDLGAFGGSLNFPGAVAVDPDDDSVAIATSVAGYNACGGVSQPGLALFNAAGGSIEASSLEGFSVLYATVPGLAFQGASSKRLYVVTRSPYAAGGDVYGTSQVIAMAFLNKPGLVLDPVAEGSVTRTEAELTGSVNPKGFATEWHFEYSSDGGGSWTSTPGQNAGAGTSPVAVSASVSGLKAETSYQVRLVATNSEGTKASGEQSFTTRGAVKDVTTAAATALTTSGATLNGSIVPGGIALTKCEFEYGSTEALGSTVPCAESPGSIGSGETAVPVHADLTGLSSNVYYFRLAASNSLGTTRGQTLSLAIPGAPAVLYQSASSEERRANLRAIIDPNNVATEFFFEYGPTAAYGLFTEREVVAAANDPLSVTQEVKGLTPETAYHFRVVAINARGEVAGADQSFVTDAAPEAAVCPNAPIRAEQGSVTLPDCRAYEQVSPPDKQSTDVFVEFLGFIFQNNVAAAADGSAAGFQSTMGFGDAESGNTLVDYVARRGPAGWTTTSVAPKGYGTLAKNISVIGWSSDISRAAVVVGGPSLAPGAGPGAVNLYQLDPWAKAYRTATLDPGFPQPPNEEMFFGGGSDDLSTLVFEDQVRHTSTAPEGPSSVYAWSEGKVSLVSVLPDPDGAGPSTEMPAPAGAGVGPRGSIGFGNSGPTPVSRDGRRIFFSTPNGRLYVRIDNERTVEVSASQKTLPAAHEPATFRIATPSGRFVFFTTAEPLLDADANSRVDIYRYDVTSGELILIDAALTNPNFDKFISAAGASSDGSRFYFTVSVVEDGFGRTVVYLWDDGEFHRVAAEGEVDSADYRSSVRVTPAGDLTFLSSSPQILSNPFDPNGNAQVYFYDATTNSLSCASCRRDGKAPAGSAMLPYGSVGRESDEQRAAITQRSISEDGHYVFFTSPDPLVSTDVNEKLDAYQYDTRTERTRLISTGRSEANSLFVDASADGSSVFFGTREPLVRGDIDGNFDLYVARANGGFPQPPPPLPCSGESCKGAVTEPLPQAGAGSARFDGAGNDQRQKAKKQQKKKHKKKAKKRGQGKKRSHKAQGTGSKRVGK